MTVNDRFYCVVFFPSDGFAYRVFLSTDNKWDELDYPLDVNTMRYTMTITADTDLSLTVTGMGSYPLFKIFFS